MDTKLEHFGVKGMRWGVTKDKRIPQDVTVRMKPGKKLKTKGGIPVEGIERTKGTRDEFEQRAELHRR